VIRLLLILLVAALAVPEVASAAGRRSGHHFHHRVFVGSAFYFGAPWYAYHYPPYYYGPYYEATSTPPAVYVEKFDGTPNANSGEIYCPSSGQYYPDVQDCSNGWQRIIRAEASAAPAR
jgi:hypothetical protein